MTKDEAKSTADECNLNCILDGIRQQAFLGQYTLLVLDDAMSEDTPDTLIELGYTCEIHEDNVNWMITWR